MKNAIVSSSKKLIVASSPHLRSPLTTQRIMLDVIIALLPAVTASIILFRQKALWMILVCVLSALATEAVFQLLAKREQTIMDGSALVTGLILALNTHANVPLWQASVGTVFAVGVVKLCFGGLGKNFANPAMTGRIFITVAFAEAAGGAYSYNTVLNNTASVIETMATPLNKINEASAKYLPPLMDMFLGRGNCGGALGEVCKLAILIGFAYLMIRRVITWHAPTAFVGTSFILAWILSGNITFALYHVLAGGLLFGAVFMATDYVTTPINKLGKLVFGFGCALITMLIRFFGAYAEGVSFAIVFMNVLTPYIEKWTRHRPLGSKRGGAKK